MNKTIFGHLHKSIISYSNMIDCGLILVPKFIRWENSHPQHQSGCMSLTERHKGIVEQNNRHS